jgi:hypothetical protein
LLLKLVLGHALLSVLLLAVTVTSTVIYHGWGLMAKENIKKARDIALDNCLDISQIRGDSPDFFVQGEAIGLACRSVGHTTLAKGKGDAA